MMYTRKAFTIVELLIVIVVIAILATLTIVAYNGIQNGAKSSSLQSDLSQAAKQLDIYKYTNSETYPADQTAAIAAGIKASSGNTITYYNNSSSNTYCLESTNSNITYSISSISTSPTVGPCTENSLVGWWPFNGNANDSTVNGNNGTVTGATLTTGQSGQSNGAYSINGIDGSGILASLPQSGITDATLTAWAYVNAGTTKGTIAHVGLGNGYSIGIGDGFNSTNNRYTGLFPGRRWITSSFYPTTGWHLFSIVLDSSSTPRLFVDNNDLGQFSGTNPLDTSNQISIGRNTGDEGTGNRIYNGAIDDVRLFKRALSAAEIAALYAAGAQ